MWSWFFWCHFVWQLCRMFLFLIKLRSVLFNFDRKTAGTAVYWVSAQAQLSAWVSERGVAFLVCVHVRRDRIHKYTHGNGAQYMKLKEKYFCVCFNFDWSSLGFLCSCSCCRRSTGCVDFVNVRLFIYNNNNL